MHGNVPKCECLKGYVPKFPEQWNISYWFSGCVTRNKSICKNNNTDSFWRYTNMKLPDSSSSWFNKTMKLEECQKLCLKNCSCSACANLDIRSGGSGCLLWFDDLVDMRRFSQWGQDLYIRVPALELDNSHGNMKNKIVGITIGVIIFGLIACVSRIILGKQGVYCYLPSFQRREEYSRLRKEDINLPIFDLSTIAKATNNFSSINKLGEGGFGPVYKGTLIDGLEVAIKRNSKMSDQGSEEFKNEVITEKSHEASWLLHSKISDFGLAWTFGGYQIESKTKRVVGTYGYMPPEYAVHGRYSLKSDVFSFGVIVLEIAWRLWTEDRPLELIGKQLREKCNFCEVLRCMHVGLLCVQQKKEDRPDMSSVILMMNGEKLLPRPKAPGFYTGRGLPESVSSSRMFNLLSTNEIYIIST
ncbi:G-type lectin S-receptor-like serine/threonine-protein kinase, partial [Mucuna pruriens]